jgi:hypothetical protein
MTKLEELETKHKKELNKYYIAMSYRIMSVEIDALYNVLILKEESEYELTRGHESNVREILGR